MMIGVDILVLSHCAESSCEIKDYMSNGLTGKLFYVSVHVNWVEVKGCV